MSETLSADIAVDALPRRHLRLLGEAADRMLAAEDPAAMVDDLFALIAEELRLDVFFNYRLDGEVLTLVAHAGLTEAEAASGAQLIVGQAVCGCAARQRRPIQAFNIQASDNPLTGFVRMLGIDAYACTPLVHGTELLGTLGFGRRWTDHFDADELTFLHTICHYVALAKYRLKIEAELRAGIASRERLLGELNHRVRNALQTAIAVVRLGAADTPDDAARAALAGAAERLEVLAAAHRPLYATDSPSRIDIAALIESIADRSDDEPVEVAVTGTPALPVEQAAAVALLTHAVLATDPDIVAHVAIDMGTDLLRIALTGPALGQARPALDEGRLVRGLARQLRAEVTRDGTDGLTIAVPVRHDG
ncbi:MAG: GAF domain-containing protein [Sphingomonas paucimobilis]